jgi:GNAT superfamily N-acetyltransferase
LNGPGAEVLAAFELERYLYRAAATRFERLPCGFVCANESLPMVWDASRVQVEPDGEVPAVDELLELAALPSTWHPGLRHREAFVFESPAGRELAYSLARRGWHVSELWLMVRRDPPDRVPPAGRRIQGPGMRRLKGRLGVEQGLPPAGIPQFDRYDELRGRAGARLSFAGLEGGAPLALADAYLRGDVAVIEDVATLKRARGRGLGTAAVLAAVQGLLRLSARAVYLFSAPDVAEGFYVPLGFERIGGAFDCQLAPPGEKAPWG